MEFKDTGEQIVKEEAGKEVAYIKYRKLDEDTLEAYSTFVDESQRGQGVARKLVDELVKKAEQENYKIKPTCSYVVDLFDKKPETYGDIKAK